MAGIPRALPFVVMAPAAVVLLGTSVVLVVLLLGMKRLDRKAEDAARLRAEILGQVLTARLVEEGVSKASEAVGRALEEARSAAVLLDVQGRALHHFPNEKPLPPIPKELDASGSVPWNGRTARYVTIPLTERGAELGSSASVPGKVPSKARLFLLTEVEPNAKSRRSLATSLLTFATLLLGAAGLVAWTLARDVHSDVLYVRRSIAAMAEDSTGETRPIAVRTIDQVGQLTASFNVLLGRFRAAEGAYRQDLSEANAFDQDRSAFLAALSHELRTPLNSILGFTDVLLSEIDGPLSPDARENLSIVRQSGNHLRGLIDDILALSALESGQFRLSREELDVTLVAQDVVTESVVTADQKGIYLELVELADGPVTAFVDRRRLRQIIQNVVSNAVKFTVQGGVIVTVGREGDDVWITVSDTGPGIAPEAQEAIFHEFSQARQGGLERQGTGLGLAITRRLVQMHGGSVKVESAPDQGSTFSIRLPQDVRRTSSAQALIEPVSDPLIREVKHPG